MTTEIPVTDDTIGRIRSALDVMAVDPSAGRTKREVERLSGLSHDTVARAFRQDRQGRHGIVARYETLTGADLDRRSDHRRDLDERDQKIRRQERRIRELHATVDRYAMTILVLRRQLEAASHPEATLTPFAPPRSSARRRRRPAGSLPV
ncbi:MAG: hypothetical protein ACRDX8_04000 [Acidimicrobiales bacterium]